MILDSVLLFRATL